MADLNKYVQTNTFYLAGSGSIIGATSLVLTSLTDIYGNVLTMTDFGTTGYFTSEPDTTNEESGTFTGVTANTNGTYTLTGVKTTLAKSPYTQTSGLIRQHSGGTKLVITDNVAFWDTFANKANDETITGTWLVPTGGTGTQVANATDIANAVIGASGTATNLVFGTVKLSLAAVSGANPIAVGDNDLRMAPTTGTSGGILGWTSTTVRASSVLLTQHALIIGGGAGATPTPLASLGTTTTVLHGNASGDPTFGAVSLTADVTGVLPIANMSSTSYISGNLTSSSSTTQNVDTVVTCGFTPKNITIYYLITGFTTGVAKYSSGIYVGNSVGGVFTQQFFTDSNASTGTFGQSFIGNPIVGAASGTYITVTLAIINVTSTGFTLRALYAQSGNPTGQVLNCYAVVTQ